MTNSIRIKFEAPGADTFESYFDHIAHVPDDFRPAWDGMAEDFWGHEQEVFDSEGPGWVPLSERYGKWKEKHYPGMPILVRTGALKASLTGGFAEGSIFDAMPAELKLGTSVRYAMYHQTGSIKVADHPPKRTELTVPDGLQAQWNRRLVKWLRDELDYKG